MSELGRSPLYFDTVRNILVYGNRLENISTASNFKLLKDAYLLSKSLHEKGTASWYSSFNYLKDTLKITDQQFLVSIPKFKSSIKKYIKIKKCEHWYHDREKLKDGKLSTYLKLKSNVGFEPYLQIVENLDYRRSITRIRISSHKLQIESGRYNNTPRELRFCNKCNENMIEDEIHFLLHCQKYNSARTKLYDLLHENVARFFDLNDTNKLIYLLNCEMRVILNSVGKFIYDNM